jgi:predicted outer membrane repeat protein
MRVSAIAGALAVVLAVLVPAAQAVTIHVPDDQPTIESGLEAASAGDTVLVACGTYYEHAINLKSGVALMSETGEADCVTVDAEYADRVFRCEGADDSTSLSGFTAIHGDPQADNLGGGGMYCVDSDLSIENCVFAWNKASRGAGMRCDSGSSPKIAGCVFLENNEPPGAGYGGGMECSPGSSPTLTDVDFVGNFVQDSGGGMWCETSSPLLIRVRFVDNWAYQEDGGGMYCGEYATPTLIDVEFTGNRGFDGGGLYAAGCPFFEISGCTFFNNTADSRGGAIRLDGGSSPLLMGTTIVGNKANHGSGIFCQTDSHPQLSNCIVAFGETGDAAHCFPDAGCSITLTCCDVYGNEGGDWIGCIADQSGGSGNLSEDPLFCDLPGRDLALRGDSPCAPAQSGACGLIGALDVGCDAAPVQFISWGVIKARFR